MLKLLAAAVPCCFASLPRCLVGSPCSVRSVRLVPFVPFLVRSLYYIYIISILKTFMNACKHWAIPLIFSHRLINYIFYLL